jgi:putative mRNA 3-end processing factor
MHRQKPELKNLFGCTYSMALLLFNNRGIYCPPADVYIDPWKPVKRALITHAHADHSRWGMEHYLAHHHSVPVMRHRLGENIKIEGIGYGEVTKINGVQFSFHPAGHIPGSSQIKVSYQGETWVVSGDYKLEEDGLCTPFEPVECQHFITESTFGLPVYSWPAQAETFTAVNQWWQNNQKAGKISIIAGYALGKAQRILQNLDSDIGPIFTHGAVEKTNAIMRKQGFALPTTTLVTGQHKKTDFKGGIVVCPPAAIGTPWAKKFSPYATAFCSGWMALRGARRRRAADRGFVLSDHADWPGLNEAVAATGAENVYVTHGYKDIFARWLREEKGLNAQPVDTLFEGESLDSKEDAAEED